MEWTIILSFATLKIQVKRLGEDYYIIMQGGDKPHIGMYGSLHTQTLSERRWEASALHPPH